MGGDRRGFTLLEMLVATTLLAVMAGILATVFRMAVSSVSRGEEKARESARLRGAVAVVERALRSADPMPLPGSDPPAPFFRGERDRLRFLTASPPLGLAGEGLRLLSLRRSAEGELALWDASPFREGAQGWEGTGAGRPLLPSVASLSLSYSAGPGAGGEVRWADVWDGAEAGSLPAAVRVEVVTEAPGEGRRTTAFVVTVPGGARI